MPTAAIRLLRARTVAFSVHPYPWQPRGGAAHAAAACLGLDWHCVIKTLVMQDQGDVPFMVLMHGDREVSTRALARCIGCKSVQPCTPQMAQRHTGYLVGGTAPFATRRAMPLYIERSILALERIAINGGRRGLLLQMSPQVCTQLLQAQPVDCVR